MSFPGNGSVYSVTVKPSTRSARSISVTSVLKLWRHGGRREPPIWLRPAGRAKARCFEDPTAAYRRDVADLGLSQASGPTPRCPTAAL